MLTKVSLNYKNPQRYFSFIFKRPVVPKLKETWWGPGRPKSFKPLLPVPFEISISDKEIQDLKWRLDNHRPFTPPLEGIQQQYGINTKLLKNIVEFWKAEYNWKVREKFLNKFPQYKINVHGLDIHYLHVKPKKMNGNVKVLPLLLVHGFGGSVREFYKILPYLTTPKGDTNFVFEVIVPHLPGYGFSESAAKPGLGCAQVALIFHKLMLLLGFSKFYCQGGDLGAITLQYLSVMYPESVLGFHTNLCYVYTPKSYFKTLLAAVLPYKSWYVRPDHYHRVFPLAASMSRRLNELGYFYIQATKPDTIGVAINDSPVGLAAYILEKYLSRTKTEDEGLKEHFSYTDLLDNVMIYWWTKSATTSFRLYAETFNKKEIGMIMHPVKVPTALARFQYDFYAADGILKEIYPNLLHLSDYPGGHFAALQSPEILAQDIFMSVNKFENYHFNSTQR